MKAIAKWSFLAILSAFFIIPMLAMARFAFQSVPVALLTPETLLSGWSIEPILTIFSNPQAL
ncbi:MAG: hypothetical protein RJB01_1662, partial [Actinomycetota bacterium]